MTNEEITSVLTKTFPRLKNIVFATRGIKSVRGDFKSHEDISLQTLIELSEKLKTSYIWVEYYPSEFWDDGDGYIDENEGSLCLVIRWNEEVAEPKPNPFIEK